MISVLRLGHRRERDARISTHCGLVSRALGAKEIVYTGDKDEKLLSSVKAVTKRWGGPFKVKYSEGYRSVIKRMKAKKFVVAHLSMYGMPFEKKLRELKRKKNLLIVIGAEKVPGDVYALADFNLAVTNQPHSEVAALAVVLHSLRKAPARFKKAKLRIVPQERGKKVVNK